MQNLHVLTNNHLGNDFWELRTGLIGGIEISELQPQVFQNLLNQENNFFLVDFYFSGLSLDTEIRMINDIIYKAQETDGYLRLFILSPFFSCTEMNYQVSGNKVIITHNFSNPFLRKLMMIGKKSNGKRNQA